MSRLYLIRHAKPAATWSEAKDPGLDATGHEQAASTAAELATRIGSPLQLYTSPLLRCRETAMALEKVWQRSAQLMPEVAEIPAPPLPFEQRHLWLQQAMAGSWTQLQEHAPPGSPDYLGWRRTLLDRIASLTADSVIFSHYIAINAIVAATRNDDAVICFRPDHASISIVEIRHDKLELVELGRQAQTLVLTR